MPRLRPVIRLFVSSTFSDMKHERNALQAEVFPKLEQLCSRSGFQFQAIDLRWGVPTEAGFDHRTMRICFEELRRAQEISPQPNFLVLLGNRYGWRPLPEEISIAEFQALEREAGEIEAATAQPAPAVLRAWYRRDENADPPVYILQSRNRKWDDGRDYTDETTWNQVQHVLWAMVNLNRAQPPERLRGRFDEVERAGTPPPIVRFQASATEQEIWHGALCVPDAREHVLAFLRKIEQENIEGFSDPKEIKDFVDVSPSGRVDRELGDEQERLKKELARRLEPGNVLAFDHARLDPPGDSQASRAPDVTTDHLAQLCAFAEGRLMEVIQKQIDDYWHKTAQASAERAQRELAIEQDKHERFGLERGSRETFVGRKAELKAIWDYVRDDTRWPLVVHGASGCGKTALLARAAQEMSQPCQPIVRFLGVTPQSSDLRSLLDSLCQALRLRHPREGALPADAKALREELLEHFRAATAEQPLVLFLDALDQLSDTDDGRSLHWLPLGQLRAHVKLVVSCLSDRAGNDPSARPYSELVKRQLPADHYLILKAMSEDEARALMFERWLPQAKPKRRVNEEQRAAIERRLASEACRQPIYLKLLFEEARLWRSYDMAPELGEGVPALVGQLFDRLCEATNHGPLLVERALVYVAMSRWGLAENELLEILFADPEYKALLEDDTRKKQHEMPANATRIPIAIWSRLRFDLAPYLTERAANGANVLTFYHRQVTEWVPDYFKQRPGPKWPPHERLANYFLACAKGTNPAKEWETESVRGFSECIFHLVQARNYPQVSQALMNFLFIDRKITRCGVSDMRRDCDMAAAASGFPHLGFLERAIGNCEPVLQASPLLFPQSLLNILKWESPPNRETEQLLDQIRGHLSLSQCWVEAMSPGRAPILRVSFAKPCYVVAASPSGKLVAGLSAGGGVEIHNVGSGEILLTKQLPSLRFSCLLLSDEGSVVALTRNNKLWLESTWTEMDSLGDVDRIAQSSRHGVIAASRSRGLVTVDPFTGRITSTLLAQPLRAHLVRESGSSGQVLYVSATDSERQRIHYSGGEGWRKWEEAILPAKVDDAQFDVDGVRIVMACSDRCLRVFDMPTRQVVAEYFYERSPTASVYGPPLLIQTAASSTAILTTAQGQAGIWDWATGIFARLTPFSSKSMVERSNCIIVTWGTIMVGMSEGVISLSPEGTQNPAYHRYAVTDLRIASNAVISISESGKDMLVSELEGGRMVSKLGIFDPTVVSAMDTGTKACVATADDKIYFLDDAGLALGHHGVTRDRIVSIGKMDQGLFVVGRNGGVMLVQDGTRTQAGYRRPAKDQLVKRACRVPGMSGLMLLLRESERGNFRDVIIEAMNEFREKEIAVIDPPCSDMAIDAGGRFIAVAGLETVLFVHSTSGWSEMTRRKDRLERIAFLGAGNRLAGISADLRWIEILSVAEGLPSVSRIHLPFNATCIDTLGRWMAIGYHNGTIQSFLWHGTEA